LHYQHEENTIEDENTAVVATPTEHIYMFVLSEDRRIDNALSPLVALATRRSDGGGAGAWRRRSGGAGAWRRRSGDAGAWKFPWRLGSAHVLALWCAREPVPKISGAG
jgi:hypothetical protein